MSICFVRNPLMKRTRVISCREQGEIKKKNRGFRESGLVIARLPASESVSIKPRVAETSFHGSVEGSSMIYYIHSLQAHESTSFGG